MIKTIEQARAVQSRRQQRLVEVERPNPSGEGTHRVFISRESAGKRDVAAAVRRFLKRHGMKAGAL